MADVNRGERPLSPHLQVYRPQLTSVTSILVRLSGNALLAGALLLVWWLLAAAAGPGHFAVADRAITSWPGDVVMCASLWALWYHLLGGLRHLVWDTGRALEVRTAEWLGIGMIAGSVLLTALTVYAFQA